MPCSELSTVTVADECRLRGNDRHGLAGLVMRHVPSGVRFISAGSRWSLAGKLLILSRPALDPRFSSSLDVVLASDCVLIDPWPVPDPRRKPPGRTHGDQKARRFWA